MSYDTNIRFIKYPDIFNILNNALPVINVIFVENQRLGYSVVKIPDTD